MSEKNYQALVNDRIFIGGADDAKEVVENEKADVVFDLRAEAPTEKTDYNRIHSPIVDDAEGQEESIKYAIDSVLTAYEEGKTVFFHCAGGSNRTGTVAIGTLLGLGEASSVEEAEEKAKFIRPKINVKLEMKEALKRIYPEA
ncbi:dual specificity protein phosphatase family protein [Mesobacillus foraminis]|uniref:protein-tyrosine phosphatase family protein n=1 Tax=Mesobacillus foraminis TaxID=279826 RepID=UPI001BE5AC0C|nr:dual specificity protein phosphatase family protein [Mesobacillus foraminis]MBT2755856.1 dual specificity protein phosphatase family protein [Mesobacillus foraminis]